MRRSALLVIGIISLNITLSAFAADQQQSDIEQLRAELNALRSAYETSIQALEQRVVAAEEQALQTTHAIEANQPPSPLLPQAPIQSRNSVSSLNAFNPAIGVIFQGQAWDRGMHRGAQYLPGFPLGGEAGQISRGFTLGETEIDISANVDDKFMAWLTLPVVLEDGEARVELEEAWIETLALSGGLSARFGRMFSGIGYLNSKHAHSWDFLDQPLSYQVFLGDQYLDDGVQLRWLVPTDLFLELGAEILRGNRFPAAGAQNAGFGTRTFFAHTGGDAGISNSWLAGLSYLRTSSKARESGDEDELVLFDGDTEVFIAEFVWKWAPLGNWKQKNFKLQGEYFWRNEVGDYRLSETQLSAYDAKQNGWYVQAIFQPFPQWRVGSRYDKLSADNPGLAFTGTPLEPLGYSPRRTSFMLDWSNSEFSRLRFQYSHDSGGLNTNNQWGVQYTFSIGAHGAHEY